MGVVGLAEKGGGDGLGQRFHEVVLEEELEVRD